MNAFAKPGMATWQDQEKDRIAWNEAMIRRNLLIKALRVHGIKIDKKTANQMKIKVLEDILRKAREL